MGPGCPPWEESGDCKHLNCHQLSPGQRLSGPPPLPRGFTRRNHVHTDHPTHVQVRGNRLHCPLAGVTGASGSPRAPSPVSHHRDGPPLPAAPAAGTGGQAGGVCTGSCLLQISPESPRPSPAALGCLRSWRSAVLGCLRPLGLVLGSGPRPLRRGHFSAARLAAAPARPAPMQAIKCVVVGDG